MRSDKEAVFLRGNVVFEPLIDRWYAWPQLISPATAACNIAKKHIAIMKSYLQAPQVHQAACKNPKMRGGPFMDYGVNRSEEVRRLLDETLMSRAPQLELAEAIFALQNLIRQHPTGSPLSPLYDKVPEPLRGYVELVYDANGNASFRLLESLLYRSRFHDDATQVVQLWLTQRHERPFVLSTPRLRDTDDSRLELNVPFRSDLIDRLSRTRSEARPWAELKELLGAEEQNTALLDSLVTSEPPKPVEPLPDGKVRVRYLGHACVLVETPDANILIDPLLGYPMKGGEQGFGWAELPERIDLAAITHNHQDHVMLETLLPLRHRIGRLVVPRASCGKLQDPSLLLALRAIGFPQCIELSEMEEIRVGETVLTGVPFFGEHGDLDIPSKLCYHIRCGDYTLFFAADSAALEERAYDHIFSALGPVDTLFLGMECDGAPLSWLYGPLMGANLTRESDNARRLSGSASHQAQRLLRACKAQEAYVYAMGQEPWVEFVSSIKYEDTSRPIVESDAFVAHCRNKGVTAERLYGTKELLRSIRK